MAKQKFLKFYHPGVCKILSISYELRVCLYGVTFKLLGVEMIRTAINDSIENGNVN